ncbi:VIT domain-containing protein [Winogradskyella forsetii]|uniref:VIT domain-containing protein n=1 Tax=Winogradskyella forsetii TaxID=2686077 RepID=UPI001E5098B2|nr:VIT domain-containing protein [Winogradskyella forsetii]
MKNVSLSILMLFMMAIGHSQDIPTLNVKDQNVGLSSLDIKVDIIGNIATTTYDMLYYNPTNEVLEGELSFPLGKGHNVSRFALDVNGKLREAVIVDKELGRIAFEQVVREGVDPALLEKGTGNNYKARIYPIPANGYKRVVLAYEQELVYNDGSQFYNLPLNFKNKLKTFQLEIQVLDQKEKPIITEGQINGLEFSNWEKNYKTSVSKTNYAPNKSLLIKIPVPNNAQKTITSDRFFYTYKTLDPKPRLRQKPKTINLYWDISLSMTERDFDKEEAFIKSYLDYLDDVTVNVITFSNTIKSEKQFDIKNGISDDLVNTLKHVVYDGGTNYDALLSVNKHADAILLFSDGIATLSELNFTERTPVFIVNSIVKTNHNLLNNISELSNGAYIDLNTTSNSEALELTKNEPFKFLGFTSYSKNIEIYPTPGISVKSDFSITGKNFTDEKIKLDFGYGDEITKTVTIDLTKTNVTNEKVKRIWAQKKLNELELKSKENKDQIKKLGLDYNLVTDYTSLIVLDNVMDYIRYKITPPEELLEAYNKVLAQLKMNNEDDDKSSGLLGLTNITISDEESDLEMEAPIQSRPLSTNAAMTRRFGGVEVMVRDNVEVEEIIVDNGIDYMSEEMEINESMSNDMSVPFAVIDTPPTYPGCSGNNTELKSCLSEKIRSHLISKFDMTVANQLGLSGRQRVMVMFSINIKGNVENIRIRSPHDEITTHVKSIIGSIPQMIPGKQRGEPIGVTYTLPIVFNAETNEQITIDNSTNPIVDYEKYNGKLKVKDRIVNTDYLNALRKAKTIEEAYKIYLTQRNEYLKMPAYYVDVSNHFSSTFKDQTYSNLILSNIAETDFDNYELLKVYAYQLQYENQHEIAIFFFMRILELRPEDSQSYRDLALAYQNIGKCQQALELFNSIITGKIYENGNRRVFKGIKRIAENEIKHLITLYEDDLDLSEIDKKLIDEINYDIRVVVDWNHNDTDIDLHIIDPNLEECFYSHPKTKIGGCMSPDMTQGFGPEEFTLPKALKGNYFVKIKYYGDRYQKIENPTFMKVTIFKNYGSKNQSIEKQIIRLTKSDDEEIIAKLSF